MNPFSYSYRVPLSVPYWNGATYRAILRSFSSGSIIEGQDLGALRRAVTERLRVEGAVLCGSGSLALEIALRACGVREGDEVIIPTFCCSSIVPPILAVGALPVLADVGGDLNINVNTAAAVLTEKTRAIIVPHLFGNPADIEPVVDLARRKNIRVIDDAAQAFGATIDGRAAGSFGDAGILSFGSEKVCFGLGGGAVVSQRKEVLNGNLKIDLSAARLSPTVHNFLSTLIWRRWRRWTLRPGVGLSRGYRRSRVATDPLSRRNSDESQRRGRPEPCSNAGHQYCRAPGASRRLSGTAGVRTGLSAHTAPAGIGMPDAGCPDLNRKQRRRSSSTSHCNFEAGRLRSSRKLCSHPSVALLEFIGTEASRARRAGLERSDQLPCEPEVSLGHVEPDRRDC